MYFNYLALIYILLADATAISYAVQLFTVLMVAILLKETVRFYRWLAFLVGFSGIVVMLSSNLTLGHRVWASGFTFDDDADWPLDHILGLGASCWRAIGVADWLRIQPLYRAGRTLRQRDLLDIKVV